MSSSSSWKKYGGINKLDKMNFLNVNSIVTDTMTLREAYVGTFDICGNVTISEKLSVDGKTTFNNNVYVTESVDISKNVIIDGNILVNGNSTFTNAQSVFYNNVYFGSDKAQYFYGNPNGIGVNIQNPNATLDICGNRVEVLNVFSDLSSNRNIIARNINKQGIVVSVDNSNSTIDFFNDASINPMNRCDGRIQYQKGGIMVLDVSDNTYVASKFAVSNRDASAHVMRETAVIYDICNNTYAYNVYDISSANTGNAVSLIASDNSSNTFLNIVTPGKNGLSIGGGAYPLDRKKAMGTIGLYDASSDVYRPTQNIVRGSSSIKYKTTLGINTHAPRIDNYVVDINGPIHLTNGELTTVSSNNFEIKNMVFSRTNKDYGIAFGSPYSISSGSYKQKILYTKNGGKSWAESRIVDNFGQDDQHVTELELQDIDFYSGYIYDQSYSIIGGKRNYLFYSNDGGKKWNNIFFQNSSQSETDLAQLDVIGVYIGERDNPISDYKRVVILYYDKFIIFDISLNGLNANMTANNTIIIPITNNDIRSITDGNQCNYMHGYGNNVYMVGTKILKYNISDNDFINLASHDFLTGSLSREYNSVYAYNDNYVVAVGDKIISYTKNGGTNWTNISTNTADLAIQSITLQAVYILDASNAMAVGNNGKIIYTTDGSVTWKTAANDVMNSSGNAKTLIDSNYNLNGIVMQDINSFIVSTLIKQHSSNQELGKTNIIYSFLPNLMNRVNNYVFDVSGNMGVDGDIRINNGTIMVKDTRQSTSVTTGALQISGGAGIEKDTYIGGNLIINSSRNANYDNDSDRGAVYVKNGGLYVEGNTYVRRNLTVDGTLFMRGNVVNTGTVVYNSDASFSSGTATLRSVSGSERPIQGAVVINTTYTTNTNNSTITEKKGGLYVSGNTYVGGDWLDVAGELAVNKDLLVGGTLTPNKLSVYGVINADKLDSGAFIVPNGGASIGGNIYIGGNFVLSANSTVLGKSYVENEARFGSKIDVSGIVHLGNETDSANTTTGTLVVKGGVGISGNTNIGGITTIDNGTGSDSKANGALVVKGGVGIGGNIYIGGNSNTTGNSNITGNCNIDKNTIVNGNIIINNNNNDIGYALQISKGRLYIEGSLPANEMNTGALQIPNGGASINGNLFLGGNISVGGGGVSTGTSALRVTGGAGISGSTNIGDSLSVAGVSNLTGNLTIGTNGLAKVNSEAISTNTSNGALVVAGGVGIGGNINVGGRANIAGDTIIGNADVNTASNGTGEGALQVKGGVGISGNTNIGGITKITKDTSSNKFDQGALVVTGGVGIGGNVYIDSSLNVNGFANFNNTTDSANIDYGALIVKGGVAIKKKIYVGSDAIFGGTTNIAGITTIGNTTASASSETGALQVRGGVGITGSVYIGANLNVTGTSSLATLGNATITTGNITTGNIGNLTVTSTSSLATTNISGTTTIGTGTIPANFTLSGVLQVKGGVGITDNLNVGNNLTVTGTSGLATTNISGTTTIGNTTTPTPSTSSGTGALQVKGGVGITGNVYIGTNLNVTGTSTLATTNISGTTTIGNAAASISSGTGALVVTGGVGIGGSVYIATNLNVTGTSNLGTGTSFLGTGNITTLNVSGTSRLATTSISGITTIGNTTASNSSGTGALVVTGGVGIGGNVNIGTNLNVGGTTSFSSLTVTNLTLTGVTNISNNTASTSVNSGALTVSGGVGVSGQVNATSFNAASDYRIKENVKKLDDSFSVDKLEPVSYYNTLNKRHDIGFIAHKVQELYPYLVNGEKDSADYQTLNYVGLIGILVREVQELKKTVHELKNSR